MRIVISFVLLAAAAPAQRPSFEVASIRLQQEPILETRPNRSGGRFLWTTDLHYLVQYAYGLEPDRVAIRVPGGSGIYRVEATVAPGIPDAQVRLMLQSLLDERFGMKSHRETKERDGYLLSVAKGGPLLRNDDSALPADFPKGRVVALSETAAIVRLNGREAGVAQLAGTLERVLGAPVIDRTGIEGSYSFVLRFSNDTGAELADAPYLKQALERELGLTIEKRKVRIETLVVDSIERLPTEN